MSDFRSFVYPGRMRIHRLEVRPNIPEALAPLQEIAGNLWYSWNRDAVELFARLDRRTWEATHRNPVMTLATIPQDRLDEAATDESFVSEVQRVHGTLVAYRDGEGWFNEIGGDVADMSVAYFSLEFGIDLALPIYSGGLGVLAGDHLKSASDLDLPLVAVGLLYGNGYFSQTLNLDGWQQELYPANDWAKMPVHRELAADGSQIVITVNMAGTDVHAAVWRAQVGRVPLYLLDTNIDANPPERRLITATLYGGDREHRLQQELLLGIGGVRALDACGVNPTVFHMNEGHSAFLLLERMRRLIASGVSSPAAQEQVAASTVFTTHTPVPAGNESFDTTLLRPYLEPIVTELGLIWDAFVALGQVPGHGTTDFGMTPFALRLSVVANGVSKLHGAVSRAMWQDLWPGIPVNEVPITSITNGVHPRTWLSREMGSLLDRYVGPRLVNAPQDCAVWERAETIPPGELWRVHQRRRERLIMVARNRIRQQLERRGASGAALRAADEILRPDILTIGFARRFATYKRASLLFRQPERLAKLITDPTRPVQFIFAGKAHPADQPGKELIQQIARFAQTEHAHQRLVFIEDYEIGLSRHLVSGCDVWLNAPRRPMEASGTSGMKAAMNGTLNLSIPDGWWEEGYAPEVGWSIGAGETYHDPEEQDAVECDALFNLLEQEVIPTFYDRDANGLPREWIEKMAASIARLGAVFNTHRMVMEYADHAYFPAHRAGATLASNDHRPAEDLALWRTRAAAAWPGVSVRSQLAGDQTSLRVGNTVSVDIWATLNGLDPHEVTVEALAGRPGPTGEPVDTARITAAHVGTDGAEERYRAEVPLASSGDLALSVRIRATNGAMVANPYRQLLLCRE